MTELEKLVYDCVRAEAKELRRPTIDFVVQKTGVKRSTVFWIAKQLGYKNWSDFTLKTLQYFRLEQGKGSSLSEYVNLLADAIERNPSQILVDAVGDVEICAEYVLTRFNEQGIKTVPYSKACLDKSERPGILLVLNESGMALLGSCVDALEMGYKVVAITASHDTPISKIAHVNIVIKSNKSTVEAYMPNYFTAGSLIYLEKVLAELAKRKKAKENH